MREIPLSQIKALPFDFGGEVDAFIAKLNAHTQTVGEAAPVAPHHLVELAVERVQYPGDGKPDDFVRAFKVVDDTPPPPTLPDRKNALAGTVVRQAEQALAKITPPLKHQLWHIQYTDAVAAHTAGNATAAHAATIATHAERERRSDRVRRHLAQQLSDIEDLNESNIEGWKAAPFPT